MLGLGKVLGLGLGLGMGLVLGLEARVRVRARTRVKGQLASASEVRISNAGLRVMEGRMTIYGCNA